MEKIKKLFTDKSLRSALFAGVSAIVLIIEHLGLDIEIGFELAFVGILLCGVPIVYEAASHLVDEHKISSELLVSIALLAAVWAGEYDAASEVAIFMALGDAVENAIVRKNREGVAALYDFGATSARRRDCDELHTISVGAIHSGDILLLITGDTVPTDCVVVSGTAQIELAAITGEALPVSVSAGLRLLSGGVCVSGELLVLAECAASESTLAKIKATAAEADAHRAAIVRTADKWAPILVGLALLSAFLTLVFSRELMRAVSVLVVFCPCAFVLATPAAMSAAMGAAAKLGTLVRTGDALQKLESIDTIAFDKTGTLTASTAELLGVAVLSERADYAKLLELSALCASGSAHPFARAILAAAKFDDKALREVSDAINAGDNLSCRYHGRELLLGTADYMASKAIPIPESAVIRAREYAAIGAGVWYLAYGGEIAGLLAFGDVLREDAAMLTEKLRDQGLRLCMLTGDTPNRAAYIAKELSITEVGCGLLPAEKRDKITELSGGNHRVLMCGDGINDALALSAAYVSVVMGASADLGEAADIVLPTRRLSALAPLMALSKKAMKRIRFNLLFAVIWNLSAVVLSAFGLLTPVLAALIHNIGSIFVLAGSALLFLYREKA